MPASWREELLRSHKLAVRVKLSGAEHGFPDVDVRTEYYKDSGQWKRVVKPSVAEQICSGADDKAAVAPRVMQPPLPRPLKLSSNAGLVNGKMHSDKAQSLNEPFLGPPQWQARKAASPKEGTEAAQGANLEARPMSSNRGRPEQAAAADSEALAPKPEPKKRVRWVDEALNEPIAVYHIISSAHEEWFPQAHEQLCALLDKEAEEADEEANEALDMDVAQEGAHHAETPTVTPGTSSSLSDHATTFDVPVTTEEMCPEEMFPSDDFTAQPTAMPSEGSSINVSSAAMGADKGYAHKSGMNIVVDLTADCRLPATVPQTTGADDKAAVATTAIPSPPPGLLKPCLKVGVVDGETSTMQHEGTLLLGEPFLGPPLRQASKAASPRQEVDGANLEAQPMSRKRGRPEEAAEESAALALQPAPQKRGRFADGALPEPSLECQTTSGGYAQTFPKDEFDDLCALADEEMDPANEALVMSAAQEAAQHAMAINVIPDSSSSLFDQASTLEVPDSEEQMCWLFSEDSSAYATATPGEGSSTATSSAPVSEDKDYADKGGVKAVVDIMANCSSAASRIIDNREEGTSSGLHSPALSGELAVELPCLEADLDPNCLAESQQAMFGDQDSGLPFFLGSELEPRSTVQSQPATSPYHQTLFPDHLMAAASHSAQDMGPSTTQTYPQPVHCNPAPGHVQEDTQRRARRVAGHRQGGTGASSRLLQEVSHPKISKQQRSRARLPRHGSDGTAASAQAADRLSKADLRRNPSSDSHHKHAATYKQQRAQPISQAPADPAIKRRKDASEAVAKTSTNRKAPKSTKTHRHVTSSSAAARKDTAGPSSAAAPFGCLHQSGHALTSPAGAAPPTATEPAASLLEEAQHRANLKMQEALQASGDAAPLLAVRLSLKAGYTHIQQAVKYTAAKKADSSADRCLASVQSAFHAVEAAAQACASMTFSDPFLEQAYRLLIDKLRAACQHRLRLAERTLFRCTQMEVSPQQELDWKQRGLWAAKVRGEFCSREGALSRLALAGKTRDERLRLYNMIAQLEYGISSSNSMAVEGDLRGALNLLGKISSQ